MNLVVILSFITAVAAGYEVAINSKDDIRQVCNGMYGEGVQPARIEVLFTEASVGQAAVSLFNWKDVKHLGISPTNPEQENNWEDDRVFICTLEALGAKLCQENQLGRFLTTPPNYPSVFTAAVNFDTPLDPESTSSGFYSYDIVETGYYCVTVVPLITQSTTHNSSYSGVVTFQNAFIGDLSASDYPKIAFYGYLTIAYVGVAIAWLTISWMNRRELLPIQYYITATLIFLVFEIFVHWRYYVYLNETADNTGANLFLFLVAILNAARNSISFFMLLITSMGYGIVRASLGPVLIKAKILAFVHFMFGVFYSIGTVAIPLESAGFFVFFFVIPLSLTLTAFLMWIMWSLNSTIADLAARKQNFKMGIFVKLYRLLLGAVIIIGAFFIISSISFSSRLDPDFGPKTWKTRWILIDGWLGVLYFIVLCSIAWLWRPTENNRRLALSDELPTNESDADEYDRAQNAYSQYELREEEKDSVPMTKMSHQTVVFDVGDNSDDDTQDVGLLTSQRQNQGAVRLENNSDEETPPAYKRST